MDKIALITDSCTDVPEAFAREHDIYTAPLTINFSDGVFHDKVDITPDQVYARMADEIPKTSLPTPACVAALFEQALTDGCTQAVIVTISSGLSGTFNLMQSVAASFAGRMECACIDTKSIGLGAGLSVMRAAELIAQGLPFKKVVKRTQWAVEHTHVFFCVDTLEYLYAGGRIGKATYSLGSVLNVRPIITCDEHGVYVPIAKARGRKASLRKTMDAAVKSLGKARHYRMGVVNGDAAAEAAELLQQARESVLPDAREYLEGQISPALVVHTGPGLIGVGVQQLDD